MFLQQVLNAVGGRPGGHKGRLDQTYGGLQVIPEIHYCGHDASAGGMYGIFFFYRF